MSDFPHINPKSTKAWEKLKTHFESIKTANMNDWFADDPNRAKKFQRHWDTFFVDFSKNRIDENTLKYLISLAKETHLNEGIRQQFAGRAINETEHRAVLHTALRQKEKPNEVKEVLSRMKTLSESVISGDWKGYTGKAITNIVNIGIGGSDLGPQMVVDALRFYKNHLNIHFVSNVDGDQTQDICQKLDPETTLFIVVSKSFSTLETLTNAKLLKRWFLKQAKQKDLVHHFVAVSSNLDGANKFGIAKKNILPMWDWVGGRFSLWSTVGLSICCAVGFERFEQLLHGAQQMDDHFYNADFEENIPVLLGLISIWYNNFFECETEAVLPYSHYLDKFVPYLQQAFMESNGKNKTRNGKPVDYQTGNIVWGATGTNAQHAFFQLIHQGTKLIPAEFVGFKNALHGPRDNHNKLMANFFAQTQALLKGRSSTEVNKTTPSQKQDVTPFKTFDGNKPTTTILIDKLTPNNLGALIALYEHKIFVQGFIWNIYSFDQWGVELGKELAHTILDIFKNPEHSDIDFDSSTRALIKAYLRE